MSLVITTPRLFGRLTRIVVAGRRAGTVAAADPLLQLLVSKGVLNAEEAKSLTGSPETQRAKLLELLRQKGILSASDYEALAPGIGASGFEPGGVHHADPAGKQSGAISLLPKDAPAPGRTSGDPGIHSCEADAD